MRHPVTAPPGVAGVTVPMWRHCTAANQTEIMTCCVEKLKGSVSLRHLLATIPVGGYILTVFKLSVAQWFFFASRPTQKIFDDLSRLPQILSNQSSRCLNPKGWSKICDPKVQNFCGLIINAKDLIFPKSLPLVSHSRILLRKHKNWFIFCSFLFIEVFFWPIATLSSCHIVFGIAYSVGLEKMRTFQMTEI